MATDALATALALDRLDVSAYVVPTDQPESDGTLEWESTTIVLVEASAGDETGIGYTYGDAAIGQLVESKLARVVAGRDAMDVQGAWEAMAAAIRNDGQTGIGFMALAAVDVALWDLKAKLLGQPLARLLGRYRDDVPVYGSGGFTSYTDERLAEQLAGWVEQGIPRVKMKVGREPRRDPERARAARAAIGDDAELFVDGNGAYRRKEALALAERFRGEARVAWFEEPVSSDDLEGLALLRDRAPAGMAIAAGEYGYDLPYFARMLPCVDVQQADVTRCGGITGLLRVDALCAAHAVPLSGHCAPQIHAHALCACERAIHLEYFHDHARIEQLLFDGALPPDGGALRPDEALPGLGLELKRADAARYAI
jgi:L-alanine-DL-glutamate epimerase-like enolase superfamily enzyme